MYFSRENTSLGAGTILHISTNGNRSFKDRKTTPTNDARTGKRYYEDGDGAEQSIHRIAGIRGRISADQIEQKGGILLPPF